MKTAFVWNAGGWWGSVGGGSLWLGLMSAAAVGADRPALGVASGAAFVILMGLGGWLWWHRDRMSAFAALEIWLAVASAAIAAVYVAALFGPEPRWGHDNWHMPWALLLLYPGMALVFWLRERQARRS